MPRVRRRPSLPPRPSSTVRSGRTLSTTVIVIHGWRPAPLARMRAPAPTPVERSRVSVQSTRKWSVNASWRAKGLDVGGVGSPAIAAGVQSRLDAADGGAFDVRRFDSEPPARDALLDTD